MADILVLSNNGALFGFVLIKKKSWLQLFEFLLLEGEV